MSRNGAVSFRFGFSARLKGDDGFAAQSLHLASAETLVFVFLDAFEISSNHLELQAGASRVEDQNVHVLILIDRREKWKNVRNGRMRMAAPAVNESTVSVKAEASGQPHLAETQRFQFSCRVL